MLRRPFQSRSNFRRALFIIGLTILFSTLYLKNIPYSKAAFSATQKSGSGSRITIRASQLQNKWLSLSNGTTLTTDDPTTDDADQASRNTSPGQPEALASADFNNDGVPDLITVDTLGGAGSIDLWLANPEYRSLSSLQTHRRDEQEPFQTSPFASRPVRFSVPDRPRFVGAGDFTGDSQADVVVVSRTTNHLLFFIGDGQGNLTAGPVTTLPGKVSAFTVGDINRADGLLDLALAVDSLSGSEVLVFEGPLGAMAAEPERFVFPNKVNGLAIGQFDRDSAFDLAVAAGDTVSMIWGRDRRLSADVETQARVESARLDQIPTGQKIKHLASGNFIGNSATELALLFENNQVGLIEPLELRKPLKAGFSKAVWKQSQITNSPIIGAKELVNVKVSALPHADLAIIGEDATLDLLLPTHGTNTKAPGGQLPRFEEVPLPTTSQALAVLPLRLNQDALTDLIVLQQGERRPSSLVTLPQATFVVTSTADGGDFNIGDGLCDDGEGGCTLRAALEEANFTAAADQIVFNFGPGVTTFNLAGTFSLPEIVNPVTIDGGTVAGQIIMISGSPMQFGSGLEISSGNCTITDLVINDFPMAGIKLRINGNNIVRGCKTGTDETGTSARPNHNGIEITQSSANNTIGGTATGDGNLCSGNSFTGICLDGSGTDGNIIQGNRIGVTAGGTSPLANAADGILLKLGPTMNTQIGGSVTGASNHISSNSSDGISIDEALGATIQQCLIGTSSDGLSGSGNGGSGIVVSAFSGEGRPQTSARINSHTRSKLTRPNRKGNFNPLSTSGVTIGGTASLARNIISGNNGDGISLFGDVTGTIIQNSIIGLNSTGTNPIPNTVSGIFQQDAAESTIGGSVVQARNIISGNNDSGIFFAGDGTAASNLVQGNYIGTDITGTTSFTVSGFSNGGVVIEYSSDNQIGGNTSTPGAPPGNVISGNFKGVVFKAPGEASPAINSSNTVRGNLIGTTANGLSALGNQSSGVSITVDTDGTQIGGITAGDRNVISGNGGYGIYIQNPSVTNTMIQGNYVGPNINGTAAVGNQMGGIFIAETDGHIIGGNTAATRNVISGNTGIGITIQLSPSGNQIQGNYIGVTSTGNAALGNTADGIRIENSNINQIGGDASLSLGNIISANGGDGIYLFGSQTIGNIIQGNGIGIGAGGTTPLGNASQGIHLEGCVDTLVGGSSSGLKNVIGDNTGNGILLDAGATGNLVVGNNIGVNAAGTTTIGNQDNGIEISAANANTIGGISAGERNVISGNAGSGVRLSGTNSNVISGNYIGISSTGTTALGNGDLGIGVFLSTNTLIGGTASGAGNIISGNTGLGIRIDNSSQTDVYGNKIGTNAAGTGGLPNFSGVFILEGSQNNEIGGTSTGQPNIIAFNTDDGVEVGTVGEGGLQSNSILSNSIFSNGNLGIDLQDDGPTPNDSGDSDGGPNLLQNFPTLTSAISDTGTTTITGMLDSEPNTSYRIEFFTNPSCDGSGFGEGQTFRGFLNVTTGSDGLAPISLVVNSVLTGVVTATATTTVAPFNTSEFSPCEPVVTNNTPPVLGNYNSATVQEGGSITVSPSAAPTDDGTIVSLTATAPGYTGGINADRLTGNIAFSTAKPSGQYTVTVTAIDNNGVDTETSFTLTVVNVAPTVIVNSPITRQQGSPGSTSLIAQVSDIGTPAQQLSVSVINVPTGLTISNISNSGGNVSAFIEASCASTPGQNTVLLLVADNSLVKQTNLVINILPGTANLGTYLDNSVNEGSSVTVAPNTPPSSLKPNSLVVTVTPNTFAGLIRFTPEAGTINITNARPYGEYTVQISAEGTCSGTISRSFQLTVINVAPSITPAAPVTIKQGSQRAVFPVAAVGDSGTDPGDLVVRAVNLPEGILFAQITNEDGLVTAEIEAGCAAPVGTIPVQLEVSDGNLTSTAQFSVNVAENKVPTLGSYQNVFLEQLTSFTFIPSAAPFDPDGNLTKVEVLPTNLPDGGTININSGSGVVTVTALDDQQLLGDYPIEIRATDACGLVAVQRVVLTIELPAPSNLRALRIAASRVDLSWADNSAGEGGFVIERRTATTPFTVVSTVPANSRTFSDGRVTAGEAYTYRIKANKTAGDSLPSNEAAVILSTVTLDQFYPVASTPGKTITVYGAGFQNGTEVFFGGDRRIPATEVLVVSSTRLQVTIPASQQSSNINGFLTIAVPGAAEITTQSLSNTDELPLPGVPVLSEFVLIGDANGDGAVTAVDLTTTFAILLGQIAPLPRQVFAADVYSFNPDGSYGDGKLDALDITVLRAVLLGQITL